MNCQLWSLEKYARMITEPFTSGTSKDGWQTFTNEAENIQLTLTSSHQLLIHCGQKLMESISLSSMSKCLKGVSRGDSLLVVYKMSERSHRFRMKFLPKSTESGEKQCRTCSDKLSHYFPIMLPDTLNTGSSSQQVSCTPDNVSVLNGDVTISQISQALLSNTTSLPDLYHKTSKSDVDLNTIIKLCLTDTNFPAFVGQVERELEKIKSECS
ncbi:hypothetical protein ACF0H5_023248 [Mactra antiquata]